MTRTRWITVAAGLAAGLFSAASACPESACPEKEQAEEIEHVLHIEHAPKAQQAKLELLKHVERLHHDHAQRARVELAALNHAQASNRVELVNFEGDDKYEIVINGEKTTAKVNGMRIADDLIKKTDDGRLLILDDDGEIVKEIKFGIAGTQGGVFATAPGAPRPAWTTVTPGTFAFSSTPGNSEAEIAARLERPPVMLGVLLESPSDALRAHLDLPEHALVLEKVMKGLPAAEAGLRQWDIVVEVNGEALDDERALHYALMESKPGDDMDIVVIRKGDELEVELELVAYDSGKLGNTGAASPTITTTINRFPGAIGQGRGGWNNDAQQSIERAMRELEKLGLAEQGSMELGEKFREQMERMRVEIEKQADGLERARGFTMLDGNGRLIIDPDEQEAIADDLEDRLEDLEDRLEDQLEEIEDRMEERWGRMEEMFERVFDRVERMIEKSAEKRD